MKNKLNFEQRYPLLPLRDIVIYPHMVIPLIVGRKKSIEAIDAAMKRDRFIVFNSQRDPSVANPEEKDLYENGTIGEILQLLKLPNGNIKVLVEGLARCKRKEYHDLVDFVELDVEEIEFESEVDAETAALKRAVIESFENYIKSTKKIPAEALLSIKTIDAPSHLADVVASHLNIELEKKQQLLDLIDAKSRLKELIQLIDNEIDIVELEKGIHKQVRDQMEKNQREYYLNEQMKVIRRELGQGDNPQDEFEELKQSIDEAKMTEEAKNKALKELKRLEKMPPLSAESGVIRTYIEWLRDVPWRKKTKDNTDISHALSVLNEDHYGLDEVKERIVDFIAVKKLAQNNRGTILCFVGPPGVGKTSLGKSVARALGRKFIRMSLGGVRDEAEIRGHRRTYVGAMPGKIIQQMKKAGTVNPLVLLDEIDKMAMDFRGDPASALLEVLDPEQNSTFGDHYLEVPYDLSQVMFITTANVYDNIPLPLLDRMEIIELSSYTEAEKLNIGMHFLLSKQIEENGITAKNIIFSEDMMMQIIRYYTRESGVRNLERMIAKVCRKVAREVVEKDENFCKEITTDVLNTYLGAPRFNYGQKESENEVALANGLAWTAVGGDVMPIEASMIPGEGKLQLTGKLGEVMQESAQAAFTYVRANHHNYAIDSDIIRKRDFHLHVPEGAIPKDGPSAGITMAVVLASLMSQMPVRCDVAMTGEITLRGKVLPIGGLKEKVLAAHRAGIKHIIFPKENEKDLEKIPESIRKDLIFHPVSRMQEVFFLSMENPDKFFSDSNIAKNLSEKLNETACLVNSVSDIDAEKSVNC